MPQTRAVFSFEYRENHGKTDFRAFRAHGQMANRLSGPGRLNPVYFRARFCAAIFGPRRKLKAASGRGQG